MSSPQGKGDGSPAKAKELTGRVLNFLSTANNETIGACAVGLGAVTYFVLGRVGLVLIGAVGGIVLHATWDDQPSGGSKEASAESKRRKEVGLDIIQRLLDLRDRQRSEGHLEGKDDPRVETEIALAAGKQLTFDDFPPETAAALTGIVDAAIRDYVRWWYSPLLPEDKQFPFACRQTLMSFMLSMSNHVSRKRPADAFLNFLTNSTSIFIVFLAELSHALMAPGMYDRDVTEAIKIYLDENPDCNLANLLNREQQEKKFDLVSKDVLETFLDSKSYNCEPVRVFLQRVLSGLILTPTLKTCSQAPWINEWIIYLLEEGEPEIMNVIDAGVGTATGKESKKIEPNSPASTGQTKAGHQRKTSTAEQAMEDAMAEVQRLNAMIAEEETRKQRERDAVETGSLKSAEQAPTPTSSQSERRSHEEEPGTAVLAKEPVPEPVPEEPTRVSGGFTSFDQILPPQQPSPDPSESYQEPQPLTLHHAKVVIFDDEKPGEKAIFRSKPNTEYLLQIEPASSQHSGWMAARKFPDFETLHEFTSRVAKISGITAFSQAHPAAPAWKGKTKAQLRNDLEKYLHDALSHEGLAESEGMKRFLEKEQALGRPTPTKGVLGFPTPEAFQTMGKGMLDVMSAAPKGLAGGGQAVFKGVSGVFGGPKRQSTQGSIPKELSRSDSKQSFDASSVSGSASQFQVRPSQDRPRESTESPSDMLQAPPLPRRPSSIDTGDSGNSLGIVAEDATSSYDSQNSSVVNVSRPESQLAAASDMTSSIEVERPLNLPPPPSEIPDDYGSLAKTVVTPSNPWSDTATATTDNTTISDNTTAAASSSSPLQPITAEPLSQPILEASQPTSPAKISTMDIDPVSNDELLSPPRPKPKSSSAASTPLNEQETQVAIELFFAVINELYTLSSAWNIRRTLLNTAKTFLLRPGNASLESIRALVQESVIEANTSDAGMAMLLIKTRENSLPTEEEFAAWPPPHSEEERERLRIKARRLLVERGMPQALTSVMGAAASGEALGRVFDALQFEEVARGLMFALMLQGVRAVTH